MRRMVVGIAFGFWLCFVALGFWRMLDKLDAGAVAVIMGMGIAVVAMVPGIVTVILMLSRGKVIDQGEYLDAMDRHFDIDLSLAVPPARRALLDGNRPVWVLSVDRGFACVVPAEGAPWPTARRVEIGRLADTGRLIEVQP